MCAEHKAESEGYKLNGVALAILVMGISLAIVVVLWVWFGYIGPSFSTGVLRQQQASLREQYGLPPSEVLSAKQAEVPPSLRNHTTSLANSAGG